MASTIEFYWDLGSTNSYFALHLIKPVAARHGASIVPRPFNLGHVFRKHAYVLMDEPKAKIANRITDLHRWAKRHQLPFRMPTRFPIKTSPALRGALAMRRFGKEWEFMEAIFAAYTSGSARVNGLEDVAGSIRPGFDADFAIVDADLAHRPAAEIGQASVTSTWVRGEVAHQRT